MKFSFAVLLCVGCVLGVSGLEYGKIHVVDHVNFTSFFFRGDQPLKKVNETSWEVPYPEWIALLSQRAKEDLNATLPVASEIYLVDITFEYVFDGGFFAEQDFWQRPWNQNKGQYLPWMLVGAPLWPQDFNQTDQTKMINDGTVWKIDEVPDRVRLLRKMLLAGPPLGYKALVIYGHCAAGCDRTGEFVAAYRMTYQYAPSLLIQYEKDTTECGRSPSYFSTGMIGWYCLTWNLWNSSAATGPGKGPNAPLPDCLTAYTCTLFKGCKPNN